MVLKLESLNLFNLVRVAAVFLIVVTGKSWEERFQGRLLIVMISINETVQIF